MGNITEHAAPPPAFSGARRTARPGQQECPIRIWSCVLVMHRFPRDCILGGGRGGAGDSWWKLQISHIPPPAPRVPPPKGHKSPLHSPHKQNLHWRKVSFLSSASTLLLHCGASFFPSLFPSLSGSLSSPPPFRLPIAPQPSSATKLRDHVQRRQAAPAVFQVSPPTMLRSATHRNTV